jgi:hypothetical protein
MFAWSVDQRAAPATPIVTRPTERDPHVGGFGEYSARPKRLAQGECVGLQREHPLSFLRKERDAQVGKLLTWRPGRMALQFPISDHLRAECLPPAAEVTTGKCVKGTTRRSSGPLLGLVLLPAKLRKPPTTKGSGFNPSGCAYGFGRHVMLFAAGDGPHGHGKPKRTQDAHHGAKFRIARRA